MKQFFAVLVGVFGGLWLWDAFRDSQQLASAPEGAAPPSGGADSGGASGSDYGALAAAIQALAAGVQLPNIATATVSPTAAGTVEIVASEGSKRICVLAYALSGAGLITGRWRSGSNPADLWRMNLNAAAGNSGANLATAWPGYLFATNGGDALNLVTDAACSVTVTYWKEDVG